MVAIDFILFDSTLKFYKKFAYSYLIIIFYESKLLFKFVIIFHLN